MFGTARCLFISSPIYVTTKLLSIYSCDSIVDWMHCHTTKDPTATWRETWRAFERLYAEGNILSIGVSNFNVALLEELKETAIVLPHLVQNWADPSFLGTITLMMLLLFYTVTAGYI